MPAEIFFPTKANLIHRQVTKDNICEKCGAAVDSTSHLFWHYKRAKEVWIASNIELDTNMVEIREFLGLVWYSWNVKQMFDQALAQLFMIAWGIWSNRHEIWTGGSCKSASIIAS